MFSLKKLSLFSFPFVIVFIFIPNELFYYNAKEFNHDIFLLIIPFLIGVSLFSISLTFLFILNRYARGFFSKLINALPGLCFCIGLFIILANLITPLQMGPLDGANISKSLSNKLILEEFGLLIFSCLFFLFIRKQEKIVSDFSMIIICIVMMYFLYNIGEAYSERKEASHQLKTTPSKNRSEVSSLPNIYHLHLDAMQTDFFVKNLIDSDLSKHFEGFTLFKHNISSYPYTPSSVASYLTSTTFQGGNYKKWLEKFDAGMISTLKSKGYQINIIGKGSIFKTEKADHFISNDDIYKKYTQIKHPTAKQFFKLVIAKIIPNFKTNQLMAFSDIIMNHFYPIAPIPHTINDGIEPYTGHLVLKHLIKTESKRKANSEYFLAQAVIPHGPYFMDENCRYGELKGNVAHQYMQQVKCTTNTVIDFIDELKLLGRYDNSIIIIHADHGEGWPGFVTEKKGVYYSSLIDEVNKTPYRIQYHPWSKEALEARTAALLMIKPPKKNTALNISLIKSQLLDIYPSILGLLGEVAFHDLEGTDLSSYIVNYDSKLNQKKQTFYYFTPGNTVNEIEEIEVAFDDNAHPKLKDNGIKLNLQEKLHKINTGDYINFMTDEGISYMSTGLSGIEPDGRWSNGKKINIYFRPGNIHSITLLLHGFVTDKNRTQNVTLFLNQHKLGKISIEYKKENPNEFTFNIPPSAVQSGKINRLSFNINTPLLSPKDLGINQDTRLLGLSFSGIQIG